VIKDAVAGLTRSRAFEAAVALAERLDGRSPGWLRVLTYHRVDWPEARPDLNPSLISATPPAFAEQMAWLAAQYRVLSLDEVIAASRGGAPLPPRAVMVTFDDACVDFATQAWPVMSRLGLPVTLFVPTAYPDHPERSFWWDRLYRQLHAPASPAELETPVGRLKLDSPGARLEAYRALSREVKRLPHAPAMALVDAVCRGIGEPEAKPAVPAVLGWDALRRLAQEGVALAPHTRTHPLLQRLGADEAEREIAGSRDDLTRELGAAPPVFAYPDGGHDDTTVDILSRLGFELAFSTRRGLNRWGASGAAGPDRLRLRRINVGRRVTPAVFRARLLPWPRPSLRTAPAGA